MPKTRLFLRELDVPGLILAILLLLDRGVDVLVLSAASIFSFQAAWRRRNSCSLEGNLKKADSQGEGRGTSDRKSFIFTKLITKK